MAGNIHPLKNGSPRRLEIAIAASLFPDCCPISDAVATLAASGAESRGAVFTRREVAEFILDLAGYTPNRPLHTLRLLEPSFGGGDFLLPAIDRLLSAWKATPASPPSASLASCIRAVELHTGTFEGTRGRVLERLLQHGLEPACAESLAAAWLINTDFLLAPLDGAFDVVVGNPPYVRQELIPEPLIAEYRARYRTIYDRADLYIPFIERSLLSLSPSGCLAFICADRWMKNRYGGPLRALIADRFHLKAYVDMVDTPAFHSDVIAYPAITLIARGPSGPTRVARTPAIDAAALTSLAQALSSGRELPPDSPVRRVEGVVHGMEPWVLDSSPELALLRRLESGFPTLEAAGCRVGIGVATGADNAFIGPFDQLDVEPSRKLPLVMTADILTGETLWRGHGVINPFEDSGRLVDLDAYPRLKRYLEARKSVIASRHVAQKAPANWFRTIDRIYPALCSTPKLLIPDIKGQAQVVYEGGRYYPHHNLYYVTSEDWNLQALQAVLLSGIARLFVSTYSTRMRGGYLRFQAQYLRRIRIPLWSTVPDTLKERLVAAAERKDNAACNRAVFELYGLNPPERAALEAISN